MICKDSKCQIETCSGACGTSTPVIFRFANEKEYQFYQNDKKGVMQEYSIIASNFPDLREKLFNPNLFYAISNFNNKKEAYIKLIKIKELINCLKRMEKSKN